jgi:hypothetical protein
VDFCHVHVEFQDVAGTPQTSPTNTFHSTINWFFSIRFKCDFFTNLRKKNSLFWIWPNFEKGEATKNSVFDRWEDNSWNVMNSLDLKNFLEFVSNYHRILWFYKSLSVFFTHNCEIREINAESWNPCDRQSFSSANPFFHLYFEVIKTRQTGNFFLANN